MKKIIVSIIFILLAAFVSALAGEKESGKQYKKIWYIGLGLGDRNNIYTNELMKYTLLWHSSVFSRAMVPDDSVDYNSIILFQEGPNKTGNSFYDDYKVINYIPEHKWREFPSKNYSGCLYERKIDVEKIIGSGMPTYSEIINRIYKTNIHLLNGYRVYHDKNPERIISLRDYISPDVKYDDYNREYHFSSIIDQVKSDVKPTLIIIQFIGHGISPDREMIKLRRKHEILKKSLGNTSDLKQLQEIEEKIENVKNTLESLSDGFITNDYYRWDGQDRSWAAGYNYIGSRGIDQKDLIDFAKQFKSKHTTVLLINYSCYYNQPEFGFSNIYPQVSLKYLDDGIVIYHPSSTLNSVVIEGMKFPIDFEKKVSDLFKENSEISLDKLFYIPGRLRKYDQQVIERLSKFTLYRDHYKTLLSYECTRLIDELDNNILLHKYFVKVKTADIIHWLIINNQNKTDYTKISEKYPSLEEYLEALNKRKSSRDEIKVDYEADQKFLQHIVNYLQEKKSDPLYNSKLIILYYKIEIIVLLLILFFVTGALFFYRRNRMMIHSYLNAGSVIRDYYKAKSLESQEDDSFFYKYFTDEKLSVIDQDRDKGTRLYSKNLVAIEYITNGKEPALFKTEVDCDNNFIIHLVLARLWLNNIKNLEIVRDTHKTANFSIENLFNNLKSLVVEKKFSYTTNVLEELFKLLYELYRNDIIKNTSELDAGILGLTNEILKDPVISGNKLLTERLNSISELGILAADMLDNISKDDAEDYATRLNIEYSESTQPALIPFHIEKTSIASQYYDKNNDPVGAFRNAFRAYIFGKRFNTQNNSHYLRRLTKVTVNIIAMLPREKTSPEITKALMRLMKRLGKELKREYSKLLESSRYREYFINSMYIHRKGMYMLTGKIKYISGNRFDDFEIRNPLLSKASEERIVKEIYCRGSISESSRGVMETKLDHYKGPKHNHRAVLLKIDLLNKIINNNVDGIQEVLSELESLTVVNGNYMPAALEYFSHSHFFLLNYNTPGNIRLGELLEKAIIHSSLYNSYIKSLKGVETLIDDSGADNMDNLIKNAYSDLKLWKVKK